MSTTWTIIIAVLSTDAAVMLIKAAVDAIRERAGKKTKYDKRLDAIESKLDSVCDHTTDNYLSILRLTVMDAAMPMSERLIAGEKYIKAGGNGDVKHYYEQLKEAVDT